MRPAGVTEAPVRERSPRAWVDFGVDETWEPARPARPTRTRSRRERPVDSWVDEADLFASRYEDEADLFASRYGDDPESPAPGADDNNTLHDEDIAERPRSARAERPQARAERSPVPGERAAAPRGRPASRRSATRGDRTPVRGDLTPVRGERPAADGDRRSSRRIPPYRGPYVVETETGAVSVDVLAHPAHVPSSLAGAESLDSGAARGASTATGGVPGRRTVTIRGRGAERDLAFPEPGRARRPPVRRHERPGFRPDRAGLWALLLGVVLVLVAATSSHAATLPHARPAHAPARVAHVAAAPARSGQLVVSAAHK